MSCNSPVRVWRSKDGRSSETGKWSVTFRRSEGYEDKALLVPCGKCAGCLLDRARSWSVRCVLEASMYSHNCFITLTYAPEYLPPHASLVKEHFTLFMKRLRKKFGDGIRFFQCGEYGDLHGRPHYHACLFNFDFPDKEFFFKSENGALLYRSKSLEKLWPYGLSTIGAVTAATAAYVAGYVLKKVEAKIDYGNRLPEYINMSRKPGIGRTWFEKYAADVYPFDRVVLNENVDVRPPRYFDDLFDQICPEVMQEVRSTRMQRARDRLLEVFPDYSYFDQCHGLDPDSDSKFRKELYLRHKLKEKKRGF